jgi:suppressor of ftsI
MTRVVAAVAAVAVVALGVTGTLVLSGGDDGGGGGGGSATLSTPGPWTPQPGAAFQEPEQIQRPDLPGPQQIDVDLHARSDVTSVAGSPVYARTYNGEFVGPTIHARPGDTIKVTFRNELGDDADGDGVPTNIHYHGLHVSPEGESDNIFRTFDAGKTYTSQVKLEPNQPVGTYWYHAHFHGISDGQIMGGLSGLIMIDGLTSLLPEAFEDVTERQVTLRDVQLAPRKTKDENSYDVIADNADIDPAAPTTRRMVNGLYQPTFAMPSSEYELWHLANIGSDVFYKVALAKQDDHDDKQSFFIVAEDGLPVWKVAGEKELLIAPGKRFDVLVLGRAAGTYELLTLPYAQTSNNQMTKPKPIPCVPPTEGAPCEPVSQTLATITTAGDSPSDPPTLPTRVAPEGDPTAHDLSKLEIAEDDKRKFTFGYPSDGPKFTATINDKLFEITDDPIVAPLLGSAQEWELVNTTRDDHPFHIHVNGFQVISVSDESGKLVPYDARGHQDVVNIPKARMVNNVKVNGRIVIRQKFEDFDGWFVFHCHVLFHEDAGMMQTIQVRKDASTPIEPPPEASEHDAMGHAGE